MRAWEPTSTRSGRLMDTLTAAAGKASTPVDPISAVADRISVEDDHTHHDSKE